MRHTTASFWRRRPVATAVGTLTGVGVTFASWTEYQARRLSSRSAHQQNPSNSVVAVSMVDPNIVELPRDYDWDAVHTYWAHRPVTAALRMLEILWHLTPLGMKYVKDFVVQPALVRLAASPMATDAALLQKKHASNWRQALDQLGPAAVKLGQQLSIRPDLLPAVVLKELQRLCDEVEPVSNETALSVLKKELNVESLDQLFTDTPQLVASASLGQVYKGTLKENLQSVAIKIQRPDMLERFSLDLYLLQRIGVAVDTFTSLFTNQPPFHKALYESFARGSYQELDYEHEAESQILFQRELQARQSPVVVPTVYQKYTTRTVLVTEWIEGRKLADSSQQDINRLIPVGVELFLTQLLDIGKFHADPHTGNLLVQEGTGKLCLLDFGLCATVDEKDRNALVAAICHLLTRDFDTLVASDAKELGFLPADFDTTQLQPLLTKILTAGLIEGSSNLRHRQRKLMEISNELNEVFFRYPFSVPPFFALVTRGLALLEGIALQGDPDFDIFQASAPYARRRAVALLGRGAFRHFSRRGTAVPQ